MRTSGQPILAQPGFWHRIDPKNPSTAQKPENRSARTLARAHPHKIGALLKNKRKIVKVQNSKMVK